MEKVAATSRPKHRLAHAGVGQGEGAGGRRLAPRFLFETTSLRSWPPPVNGSSITFQLRGSTRTSIASGIRECPDGA